MEIIFVSYNDHKYDDADYDDNGDDGAAALNLTPSPGSNSRLHHSPMQIMRLSQSHTLIIRLISAARPGYIFFLPGAYLLRPQRLDGKRSISAVPANKHP